MLRFQANFSYFPTVIFAPANVEFNNDSSIGTPIEDNNTVAIDETGKIISINSNLSSFIIARIERYEWDFGDKIFSSEKIPKHTFELAGLYEVKLSIVSNEVFDIDSGITFRIKNTIVKNIDIGSMTYAWLQQHMIVPHIEALNENRGFSDLISSTSKMFDRMYAEIKSVANLMDVKKVAPQFLEYFSETLNHKRFYAKKIGYSEQDLNEFNQPFLDYDIFERIKKGIANDKEIQKFRQFLIDTATLFKQNGSKESMESFFKLYNFVIKIKELWTTNFGLTAQPEIIEDFVLDPTLEKSKSKFKYRGISVTGFDNSKINVINEFNNILVDNYHFISRHSYPTDLLKIETTESTATSSSPTSSMPTSSEPTSTSPTSSMPTSSEPISSMPISSSKDEDCLAVFPIHAYVPNVLGIMREDGRNILDKLSCGGFDATNDCLNPLQDEFCTENNIKIRPNLEWDGIDLIVEGVNYKMWLGPTDYVKTVINTVGSLPSDPDEIAELPQSTGDISDDFLWPDWNFGVTIPPSVVGVSQSSLKRPSWQTILPFVNYETTITNDNLFAIDDARIPTTNDFFVAARGFIKIPRAAYYTFTLETGNTGVGTSDQHIALFSLKHSTTYTRPMVNLLSSIDSISFFRDNTDNVTTVGTTATGQVNIYSKVGEYGIIEIRQNEISERSGDYFLEEGYYAFEVKAAYSTLSNKKFKLSWEAYTTDIEGNTLVFNTIQNFEPIPYTFFYTKRNKEANDIDDELGKGLLSIPMKYLEGGDNFIVSYSQSNIDNNNVSGIVSMNDKLKNLELHLRFSPKNIPSWEDNFNRTSPQKTIMLMFRAINKNKDLYADYDAYYSVILNGKTGEIGIAQVEYSKEIDGPYYRYLNLNPNHTDIDQRISQKLILDSDNHIITLENGKYYDLKLVIIDNKISVYFRNNVKFTDAISNIRKSIQQDLFNYAESDDYITIVNNLELDQRDVETEILDITYKNLDIAEKYEPILQEGRYGVAVKSSLFKIEQLKIVPLDKIDNKKYETLDKWKEVKPKYLDSRNNDLLQYNSYEENGPNTVFNPSFPIKVSENYDGINNIFPIPESIGSVDDNSVNSLYADNITTTTWGTRFNVLIDSNFIKNRFNTISDTLDGLLISYGNFMEPYINWSRVETSYNSTWQAGYTPFINETAHVLPHTTAISGGTITYPSTLFRTDTNIISLSGQMTDFINATNHSKMLGVWEEVCPNSVDAQWTVNNNSFDNQVFDLIYRNNNTKDEIIGVRILNEKILEKLMCRYCKDAIIWGLYDVILPVNSVENYPIYNNDNPTSSTTIKYFIPIGKLNNDFFTFLPSPEILRNDNSKLNLLGIYAQHSYEGFTFINKTSIKIDTLNPWENDYKSVIKCNYFLDIETSFIDHFTKYSNVILNPNNGTPCEPGNQLEVSKLTECDLPNSFYMPEQISKLFSYLEKNSTNFKSDYTWWVPKALWIKRKFSVIYPTNNDTTVFTGLNVPNSFFTGTELITSDQGTKLSLQDEFDADIGKFILDGTWCVNSVGWDAEFATNNNSFNVGIFDLSAYSTIGFDNSNFSMGTEKSIPIGAFMNAPIPLETVSISGISELLFGSYLNNETGNGGRSYMPVGLFNWFLTHANQIDSLSSDNRAGWELSDWNDAFVQGFTFNAIYGEIDKSLFKINKYWSFYPDFIPPFGSIVNVETINNTCEEIDGENAPLIRTTSLTLGISDGRNGFYSVPPIIEPYWKWSETISRVFINHYLFDSDQFHINLNTSTSNSELVVNNQLFDLTKFIGPTHFVLDLFFDKTFKLQQSKILKDDFNLTRQINWITLLEEDGFYKIAKRLPETELKFTSNKLPYEIKKYKNTSSFKLVNKFDYVNPSKFSGEVSKETEVGILGNHGFINSILLADTESDNFSISCDFIFDKTMLDKDFNKQFELILKAENNFVRNVNEWGITDFYFVGIGAFNFDVGLGMRSIDADTGNVKETFLASYGEFNSRSIKIDTWYTLKAIVTSTEIKIIFHEKNQPEKLVLNYNINKKYEKLTERYLKGEFENLQAVIVGLQELGVTYPDKLGNTVSPQYTFENFKEEFAATLPINGSYSGFRTFNDLTYVANIEYVSNFPKQYKFGSTFDGTTFNNMLYRIKNRFSLPINPDIKAVDQALNFTVFMQINDSLFYQHKNNEPEKYAHQIESFKIINDKIFIVEKEAPSNSAVGLNDWSVGTHEFTWSLTNNTQNIKTLQDFFNSVPNITQVELTHESNTYMAGLTTGTSGITGDDVDVEVGDEIKITIGGNRNIIWPLDGELGLYNINVRAFQEGFVQEYPILIKDKTFYKDGLKSYMNFADKNIKEVHINDSMLHIIFEDN